MRRWRPRDLPGLAARAGVRRCSGEEGAGRVGAVVAAKQKRALGSGRGRGADVGWPGAAHLRARCRARSLQQRRASALAAEGGTGTMAEPLPRAAAAAATTTTTMVRAALQELADDAEGREELAAFARALREEGGVKAALERPRPQRKMVTVILSGEDPLRVDSRDTPARRLGGEVLADALFQVTKSTAFKACVLVVWIGLGVTATGAFLGALPAYLGLVLSIAAGGSLWLFGMTQFAVLVLRLLSRRFEFWYLAGNLAAVGAGGYAVFEEQAAGVLWLLLISIGPFLALCFDSVARRSRATTVLYVVGEIIAMFLLAGLFFRKFKVRTVRIRVFSGDVSVNDRVFSSLVCYSIFAARFLAKSIIAPTCLVILGDLRSVKVRRSAAEQICTAYTLQHRHVEAAAAAAAAEPSRGAAAVAPAQQPRRALEDVAAAALDAACGVDEAARKLLLGMLDELACAPTEVRRNTRALQQEITALWADGGAGGDDVFERVLVPRFVPVVVESSRTIAAALGGPHLSDACYLVCRSPLYSALTTILCVSGFSLLWYELSFRDKAAVSSMYYAIALIAFVVNLFQTMLLNTVVLTKIVLRRWDTYWSLANVYAVAATGAFIFKDAGHGLAWIIGQILPSTYFLRDAAPPSKVARRIDGLALAIYASFHCYSVFAIWLHIYDVQDYFIDVLGVPVNLRQWCFAAQVNAAIIATRFAVRAISDQRKLMFAAGLIRVRMPAADARELRAVMLAEREVRTA